MNGPNVNYEFNYRDEVETNGQLDIEKVKKVLYEYELLKEKIDRDGRDAEKEIEKLEAIVDELEGELDSIEGDYEVLRNFVSDVAEGGFTLEEAIARAKHLQNMTVAV